MEKSIKLKLVKFPEKPTHDERFMAIFNDLTSSHENLSDEEYFVATLFYTLENHFDSLDGDEAYMIAFEIKKLRLLAIDFYENIP